MEKDATLEIRVLGDFAVYCNGQKVGLPQSRKTRALLAYLAVTNRPQRRERLCEMFWAVPDDPRGALRWSLSKIRQVVNSKHLEAMSPDRNLVTLRSQSIALDLQTVKAVSLRELTSLDVSDLEQLSQVFRGEFLQDLSLPRCPKFEEWRISWISEANMLKARILRTLIERLENDATRALPYARALHAIFPEDANLDSMLQAVTARAHADAGQQLSSELPHAGSDMRQEEPESALSRPSGSLIADVSFCNTSDGLRIAYSATGEGPPIVKTAVWLSHLQFDLISPIWGCWIEGLTKQNRLIRYDARGNGLSDRHVSNVSFGTMLADLESAVDASQLERFVLLGVSHGCAVSIAYAAKHPERVSHLVLYGGYAQGWRVRGDRDEIARQAALQTLIRQGWDKGNPVFRHLITALFVPEATREQMDWLDEHQRLTVSPEIAAQSYKVFANIDVSTLLPQLIAPTLVLHAHGDQTIPYECSRMLAERIPGAQLVALESNNHILLGHEQAFVRLLDELRRFIETERHTPGKALTSNVTVDRKWVTVLAIDIINPLHAFVSADPELVLRQVDPLLESTFEIVEGNGGVISTSGESGITAVFGTLETSNLHALSACQAGLVVKSTLERQSEGSIRVRVGVDTGEVVIRHRRRGGMKQIEMTGSAVRTAVKLAQSLRRGAVAITERTRLAAVELLDVAQLSRSDVLRLDRDEQVFEFKGTRSAD